MDAESVVSSWRVWWCCSVQQSAWLALSHPPIPWVFVLFALTHKPPPAVSFSHTSWLVIVNRWQQCAHVVPVFIVSVGTVQCRSFDSGSREKFIPNTQNTHLQSHKEARRICKLLTERQQSQDQPPCYKVAPTTTVTPCRPNQSLTHWNFSSTCCALLAEPINL